MTHRELYATKDFLSLQTDPRFVAFQMYLRDRRPKASSKEPHGMIQDCGRLEQHLAMLDMMDAAFRPPMEQTVRVKDVPYSSGQDTLQTQQTHP